MSSPLAIDPPPALVPATGGALGADWRNGQFVSRARTIFRARFLALGVGALVLWLPGWAASVGLDGPIARLLLGAMVLLGIGGLAALPRAALPRIALPRIALPRIALPRIALPRIALPRIALPRIAPPRIAPPRIAPPRSSLPRAADVPAVPDSAEVGAAGSGWGEGASRRPSLRRLRFARSVAFGVLCFDAVAAVYLIAATGGLRSPLLALQVGLTAVFALLFARPLAAVPAVLMLPALARIDQVLGSPGAGGLFDLLAIVGYGALDLAIIHLVVDANRREEERHEQLIRLERALGEVAVAEERARLSREIHDGLGASLSSLSIQAEYLLAISPEGPLRAEVTELRRGAEEALEELRHSLRVMRGDFDLGQAARAHCEGLERRTRLPVFLAVDGSPAELLSSEAQLTLFRLLQEALSNAVRHAGATQLEVALSVRGGACSLSIRDDGKGFDTSVEKVGHYGLRGMRERARRCGGVLSLLSHPGAGTEVRIEVSAAIAPRGAAQGGTR